MKTLVRRVIPDSAKNRLEGSKGFDRLQARLLARRPKRLDVCAAQMAHVLQLADDADLRGKVCLELGSGWVLTHSLVMHLLGAERVIATDLEAHARPEALRQAIRASELSAVRDILSPFEDHERLRERIDRLAAIRRFDFDALRRLGIEYAAPVDLVDEWVGDRVDFAFSASVLEHVPVAQVGDLLANVVDHLNPAGSMIHAIHLEDHRDIRSDPLGFLAEASATYGPAAQMARGNRIRRSQWEAIFASLPGTTAKTLYAWQRWDCALPSRIDDGVSFTDEADLRSSHLGVWVGRA